MGAEDFAARLLSALGSPPNVTVKTHLNHSNLLVGNKVFAIVKDDTVIMKLPKESVKKLVRAKGASPLVMGKRTMTEWAVVGHEDPTQFADHLKLFKQSMAFVKRTAPGGGKPRRKADALE